MPCAAKSLRSSDNQPAAISQGEDIRCTRRYQMSSVHLTYNAWNTLFEKSVAFSALSNWCIILSNLLSIVKSSNLTFTLKQWWCKTWYISGSWVYMWTEKDMQSCGRMYVCTSVWIISFILENHCSWVGCLYAHINEAMIQQFFLKGSDYKFTMRSDGMNSRLNEWTQCTKSN